MSQAFTFTVSAATHPKAPHLVQDQAQQAIISQNLQHDALWGWCVPQVVVAFEQFSGTAQLDHGSYPSQADFLSSPDYLQLQELALLDLHQKLSFAQKVFQQKVEAFYTEQGSPFHNPDYRLVQFQ